ncbi:transposase [Paeniglutamicibacter kerguelensis]|uniref:Transposase IS4-like domain-containing protein n=1 Tax=Paeniglutamicibacter kerguelensis TaxID=254788 RepID=A0ABS4XIL9_9MICC|nr:transposase [Paeniglutamicibacter kerguelensis]MBP2388103.1 hypothetical protein [Paeniglutamicibacter kerguelensis]
MDNDLDTLATAFYVAADDLLKDHPERVPYRPRIGISPRISDAEPMTLALMQAFLGFVSQARWLRHARAQFEGMFPCLPGQTGYNKRLRRLYPTMTWLMGTLVRAADVGADDVWVVDSTPVECGRSRETAQRSDLAGWAEYGYCASHSRWFWGFRLHLACTLQGLPVGFALTGAKAGERQMFLDILDGTETMNQLQEGGIRQLLIGDREYYGADFEDTVDAAGIEMLRPGPQGRETPARFPVRQALAAGHRIHPRHPQGAA